MSKVISYVLMYDPGEDISRGSIAVDYGRVGVMYEKFYFGIKANEPHVKIHIAKKIGDCHRAYLSRLQQVCNRYTEQSNLNGSRVKSLQKIVQELPEFAERNGLLLRIDRSGNHNNGVYQIKTGYEEY